jgi:DUF971 family protein
MKRGADRMTPDRLEILDKGRVLRIVWADGRADALCAVELRRACRSAPARRAEIDGLTVAGEGVRIAAVTPVGTYSVNIEFSDGQSRGIYPVDYLACLARQDNCTHDRRLIAASA